MDVTVEDDEVIDCVLAPLKLAAMTMLDLGGDRSDELACRDAVVVAQDTKGIAWKGVTIRTTVWIGVDASDITWFSVVGVMDLNGSDALIAIGPEILEADVKEMA